MKTISKCKVILEYNNCLCSNIARLSDIVISVVTIMSSGEIGTLFC
jgi:hypothetical protein